MKNKNKIKKWSSRSQELKFFVEKLNQPPTTQNKDSDRDKS